MKRPTQTGEFCGELRSELAALSASTEALANLRNVDVSDSEEFAARARRAAWAGCVDSDSDYVYRC